MYLAKSHHGAYGRTGNIGSLAHYNSQFLWILYVCTRLKKLMILICFFYEHVNVLPFANNTTQKDIAAILSATKCDCEIFNETKFVVITEVSEKNSILTCRAGDIWIIELRIGDQNVVML